MIASDRALRPLGFLLLMLGFGLRLDTPYQGVAWLLLLTGALVTGAGLLLLAQRRRNDAFVQPSGKG
jgi:hypothetical protein